MRTPDTTPSHGGSTEITTAAPVLPVKSYDREKIWRDTHLRRAGEAPRTETEAERVAREREEFVTHADPAQQALYDASMERVRTTDARLRHEHSDEHQPPVEVRTIWVGPHS